MLRTLIRRREMSRIGNLPIEIPEGASINIDENNLVSVKGPQGELFQQVNKNLKNINQYMDSTVHSLTTCL